MSESGKMERPEIVSAAFGNAQTVAILQFGFQKSNRPLLIGAGDAAQAVWATSNSLYESERLTCDGSGDEKVAIGIQFMARSDFAALAQKPAEKN